MTIGERTVIAHIEEAAKARQQYEAAKNEGKTASLLEQHRPNVFQMSVANIMPGDIIKVEMKYTEFLLPEDGVYSFVFPTVVGPRYSSNKDLADAGNEWVANPYTDEVVKPLYTFDIDVALHAGMPIQDVRSTSHEVDIHFSDPTSALVDLKKFEAFEGNRDFILEYR